MDLRCKYSASKGIALTGSTGFLGNSIVSNFSAQDFVVTDFENVPAGALIIHLAANVANSPEALSENIRIDSYVMAQVNEKHRGLIYASGNNVYPYAIDCRIEERLRCNDYYSASKSLAETLFADMLKVPYISLRIADIFGVGQRHGNFFKAIEGAIRSNSPLTIYGLGLKRRTYIHVLELAKFIEWIALEGFSQITRRATLNVGYADDASVSEIVHRTAALTQLSVVEKNVENDASALDVRTMQTSFLPGYQPVWGSFTDALAGYVDEIKLEND